MLEETWGKRLMKLRIRSISGIVVVLLGGILPLSASTITYDFGQVSSGSAPVGNAPWLQAVFTDTSMPANTVQMTLTAGSLLGSEFVSCWYFNLNPALDPTALSFSLAGSTGSFANPSIQTEANGFKAGPDGKFDVLLGFSTANGQRFTGGDSLTFTITDLNGLTASDFNDFGTPASGSGEYSSAVHVQSIGANDGSGWINPTAIVANDQRGPAVPDGSETVALLGVSLLAIEGLRRKLRARPLAQ
jgi:hypothetical protein